MCQLLQFVLIVLCFCSNSIEIYSTAGTSQPWQLIAFCQTSLSEGPLKIYLFSCAKLIFKLYRVI